MATLENFSKEIDNRLEQQLRLKREKQHHLDREMESLLQRQTAYRETAQEILASVIHPRVQTLCQHFDNAKIKDCDPTKDLGCTVVLVRTRRYPATATLRFWLWPADDYKQLEVHYEIEILPILMEYDRSDAQHFQIDGLLETDVTAWVEKKFHDFLDTYLKIESHPLYQKDNFVVDPVCGMQVPFFEVATTVRRGDHTVYFCSEVCKETLLRESV